ncbi:hypothetical protein EAM_2073 [Erwinia amylovora ATCC 49946]|nr:hypothetical protein EAM_2073 [Erwinia amylovora ATCC 49946]
MLDRRNHHLFVRLRQLDSKQHAVEFLFAHPGRISAVFLHRLQLFQAHTERGGLFGGEVFNAGFQRRMRFKKQFFSDGVIFFYGFHSGSACISAWIDAAHSVHGAFNR